MAAVKRHKTRSSCSEGIEIQDDDTIEKDDDENDVEMLDADDSGVKECPVLNIFDLMNNSTFIEDN